jgi:DNA-binding transcriptional MerR regulator
VSESITRVGRRFGKSRSTLLYYDRIGLLSPSERSAAGHRRYSAADVERLAAICRYREAGLALEAIAALLAGRPPVAILEARLAQLDEEERRVREQQRIVRRLLARPAALDKDRWVAMLRAAGLDDAGMRRWHVEFERGNPEAHHAFLVSLGLSAAEVARIRERSRATPARRRAR